MALLTSRTKRQRCCGKDRKSTRLNSSHLVISYAVFCLKKKKNYDELIGHSIRHAVKAPGREQEFHFFYLCLQKRVELYGALQPTSINIGCSGLIPLNL